MARYQSLPKALLHFVRLHWTSDWLTRSMLLGFSDLLATWRSFYCNITSYSGACHFSGVIHRYNALTAKQKPTTTTTNVKINSTSPPLLIFLPGWRRFIDDRSIEPWLSSLVLVRPLIYIWTSISCNAIPSKFSVILYFSVLDLDVIPRWSVQNCVQ